MIVTSTGRARTGNGDSPGAMISTVLQTSIDHHIAHVRLDRPDRHNALNGELMQALIDEAHRLGADRSVRAVVVSGNGPAADIRVVAPDARLGFVEITWGLMPDMSASQSLRRLVGDDLAKLLVLTGRRFSGADAAAWGLATEVVEDPVARALEIAAEIAAHNPEAVRAALAVIDHAVDADTASGLAYEASRSSELIGTANQIEAVVARLEGRDASFADPGGP